ncbi:uncharacterized protein LOC120349987 [Nilaparvata lugens]|uniref:uncharacterized protein LOC120349987 n=1 Tax=Nilaparvata lugens TaxID=108931 RepID=UPI00193D8D59|nr:uncharacterized protein LOC120349987 [Nilaparvata lugens]
MIFVNVQCLRSKINLVSLFVGKSYPDVLCISEHHLLGQEIEFYNTIEHLKFGAGYFRSNHKNGGTAVYLREDLLSSPVDLSMFCRELDIELSGVKLEKYNVIVIAVYRSPNGNVEHFFTAMDNCLTSLNKLNMPIVLGGDVNIHLNEENSIYHTFRFLLQSHGLYITSHAPTRGDNCLDTIATSLDSWNYEVDIQDPMIADHDAVIMNLWLKSVSETSDSVPWHSNYFKSSRKIDPERIPQLKAALANLDWTEILSDPMDDPEELFNSFFKEFSNVFDRIFPAKMTRIKKSHLAQRINSSRQKSNAWYTPGLLQLQSFVLALDCRRKSCLDEEERKNIHNQYIKAKRIYRQEVDLAKREANISSINQANNKCKAAWDLVKSISGPSKQSLKPRVKASPDEFNNFLIQEVEKIVSALPETDRTQVAASRLFQQPRDGTVEMENWDPVTPEDIIQMGGILLFADDTTIFARGRTPVLAQKAAADIFGQAKQWFNNNKLSLNEDKTQETTCSLSTNQLINRTEVKLLGFTLDSRLTWGSHTNKLCLKLSRVIFLLRRLKPLISRKHLVEVYFALFHSHIIYGLQMWGHAPGCNDVLLQQKKALRILDSAGYLDHCRPIFIRLGIYTVFNQYILLSLLHIKSHYHSMTRRADKHLYNTRGKAKIDVPFCRLNKKRDCFPVLAQKIFNALPDMVRDLDDRSFGGRIRAWLRGMPFYSVAEYFEADKSLI